MKNSQKPAFPLGDKTNEMLENAAKPKCFGLSKREYFAGLAMQGLCVRVNEKQLISANVSRKAIELADELLKQLGE